MWNKIKIILGLLLIGGFILVPTNDERIVADAKKYGLFEWIADCYAPGGINDQVAEYGTIGAYRRGIQTFESAKGDYAKNNRKYDEPPEQEASLFNLEMVRKILILILGGYIIFYAITSMKSGNNEIAVETEE